MFNKKISTALLISEMDENVKRMLKLVEEDADSFAKKAEMYYQKRPELVSLVEDFSRMYRSLSERFDHATGELRKTIPSEIQSQSSCISSEVLSELPSTCPSPDHRPNRRRSGHRAAGFDYFLGTNITDTELGYREGYEPSNLDYESESDNDEETLLRRKIYDLEVELCNAKEKLRLHQEDNSECSSTGSRNGNIEAVRPKTTAAYEEEPRDVMERLRLLEKMVSEKNDEVEELTQSLAAITRSYNMLVAEKAKLGENVEELTAEMTSKDDKIDAMCQHLHELQMEHVTLMSETEGERKMAEVLSSRAKELETNIKEQQEIILEGAEEKRQAIRQLCFSLEHYRTGYLRLREVINHMKSPKVET